MTEADPTAQILLPEHALWMSLLAQKQAEGLTIQYLEMPQFLSRGTTPQEFLDTLAAAAGSADLREIARWFHQRRPKPALSQAGRSFLDCTENASEVTRLLIPPFLTHFTYIGYPDQRQLHNRLNATAPVANPLLSVLPAHRVKKRWRIAKDDVAELLSQYAGLEFDGWREALAWWAATRDPDRDTPTRQWAADPTNRTSVKELARQASARHPRTYPIKSRDLAALPKPARQQLARGWRGIDWAHEVVPAADLLKEIAAAFRISSIHFRDQEVIPELKRQLQRLFQLLETPRT